MAERTPRAVRMSEVWDQIRGVLARTEPHRAEYMRDEILVILAVVLGRMREWEGKDQLPLYRKHALWEMFDADPEVIARAVHSYVHDLKPIEEYAEDLT